VHAPPPPPRPTAVLIVRAWHEDDPAASLRVRITSTLDISRGDELVSAAATPEEVYEALRAWLEAFLARRARIR
jgi:hypothetical protein